MSFLALIFQRTRWLQAPVALLSFILQRTPLLRVAATAEALLAPSAGALVKSALTLAALGAYDTVAGATVITPTPANPASATVAVQFSSAFTITGANGSGATPGSWSVLTTSLPPGLVLNGANSAGLLNSATKTVAILGTPTTAGSYAVKLTAWQSANKGGGSQLLTYTINVGAGATTAPAFTTQPSSQTVVSGASVTFTTVVTGNPAPALQWFRDTTLLSGKTAASLTLSPVTSADAGVYKLVATNSASPSGVSSNLATLVVQTAPVFTTHPASQTVNSGTNVTFTAVTTGTPTPTLQWFKGANSLPGQNAATLSLTGVTAADAGDYKVVATNSVAPAGVSSNVGTLVVQSAPAFISAATAQFQALQTGQTFTVAASGLPAPTFSATGLPAWASLNTTTGVISGTPATAQAGLIAVTLTASNGVAPAATQSFTLVVKTALRLWQEAGFTAPELANPAVSGNAAVIAPDGLSNLVHYALGYGPRQTVPASALAFSSTGSAWRLAYTRPSVRLGVAYAVESSTDLAAWTTTGVTHQLVSSAAGVDTWTGTVPAGPARVFLRLKIAEQ